MLAPYFCPLRIRNGDPPYKEKRTTPGRDRSKRLTLLSSKRKTFTSYTHSI
nr:MAG TPA: hypothetical protein [Caudoviricetes sp.]